MDSRSHEQQLEKPLHMKVEDPAEVKKKKKKKNQTFFTLL